MYANGGEEAEGYKQENGCVVGTPGWSCISDADATTFFPPSADQNQSTSKYKHVLCSDFCSDVLGMWFMAGGHMGSLDVQADGVTSNVMQLPQSEKKKVVGARKTRRSVKGSGTSGNKDLMEVYRISRPSGSKDRHSKVATARGPRDRRMRLSVETAVKFFHVQDRLGFDQPSKAVEWLIDKCSAAIDELPRISHSEFLPFSTPMNGTAELLMNCERKRSRNPKLGSFSEQKTKAKEREQDGSKRRRRGQAKLSSEAETMKLGQGLLHMNSHDFTGIRTLESLHRAAYFNCAQYSPEIGFQSYPSSSSVQSADSTTTFSCPFPRVMPSISIDPQSTMSEF